MHISFEIYSFFFLQISTHVMPRFKARVRSVHQTAERFMIVANICIELYSGNQRLPPHPLQWMKYHISKLVLYCCLIIIFLRLKQSWSTCFEFQGSHIASSSRSENRPQLARRHSKRFDSYDVLSVVNYVDCYVTTYSKYLLQPSSMLFWDTWW